MKSKVLITLLLLLLCAAVFAVEDYSDAEEHKRKTNELNQLADRFRAETGFRGEINYSYKRMKLSQIRGNFADLEITSPQDTLFMKSIFERIFTKVTPYISARPEQLFRGKVVCNMVGASVVYWQVVNGYRIEGGAGTLKISYNLATSTLTILDGTANISSEVIPINVSVEQALQIAQKEILKKDNVKPGYSSIAYTEGDKENAGKYYLCHILPFRDCVVFIDVSVPVIRKVLPNAKVHSYNVDVKGAVYIPNYVSYTFPPPSLSGLGYVRLSSPAGTLFADPCGNQIISDSVYEWLKVELNNRDVFHVTEYPDSCDKQCDLIEVNGSSITATFLDNNASTANTYYHATHQQEYINSLIDDVSLMPWRWKIVTNDPGTTGGTTDYVNRTIEIGTNYGLLSHIIRHEVSHANIFSTLLTTFAPVSDVSKQAMDEAFAVYLPCAAIGSPYCIYGVPIYPQQINVLNHISSVVTLTQGECAYEHYDARFTIASAWWELRNRMGETLFEQKLIQGLTTQVFTDDFLRYRPRYFYNILMRNSTPDDQQLIIEAYTRRGLHFMPKVESQSAAQKSRNSFSPGDQVYVNITQAPQNTPFKVYVIRHGDYTYINGAQVSTLTNHLAGGFIPVEDSTDPDGNWAGAVWTIPTTVETALGDYDIIVDFGDHIAPDNLIHFAFTNADVMDGFDGLTQPGFTVLAPPAIDIVLALDCSPSLTNRTQLARTARQFVAQLMDYDRVGVFGFASWVDNQQVMHDFTLKMIPSGSYGLTPIINNKENLCGQNIITFPSTYPYDTYSTNMITPFNHGFLYFDTQSSPKHFVTLSDGWHCLPDNFYPHEPSTWIHNIVSNFYVPSIQCHTIRYKAYPTNNQGLFPYNEGQSRTLMNNIAEWGNGTSWSRNYVTHNYWDINSILDDVRNTSSSVDQRGSYTSQNPAQDTEVIQFFSRQKCPLIIGQFCHKLVLYRKYINGIQSCQSLRY